MTRNVSVRPCPQTAILISKYMSALKTKYIIYQKTICTTNLVVTSHVDAPRTIKENDTTA